MIPFIYGSIFLMTLFCTAVYMFIWHKHYNVNICLIFTFIPLACLGHFLFSISDELGEALATQKFIYLGGSFLQIFILFSIMNLCQIEVKRWVRTALFIVACLTFCSALTVGHTDWFYKSITFDIVGGVPVLGREYGFLHSVYYVVVIAFFAMGFAVICYSWKKQKQVPRTVLLLLVIPYVIVLLSYFIGRRIYSRMDLMPVGYLIAQIMYIVISQRMNLYDVADTVVDSMVQEKAIGYVSFDFEYRYLGSNETAMQIVPEIRNLAVDDVFGYKPAERRIRHFLDDFKENPENNQFSYTLHGENKNGEDDKIYNVNVSFLYDGSHKCGYMVTFVDDTANRKYISLLDTYNEELKSEVNSKTKHIVEMHDNLIMSLATMVESRDNSTGGHIKRTSEAVRILVDAIREEGKIPLTDKFCKDVIKAAPMHDLGKIAVDDAVLKKPGRFEPEEFEKMKKHAAEGARVVHETLLHTDDESFKVVAENVAHYHHERWDYRHF